MNNWHTFYKTCIVLATIAGAYLLYQLGEIIAVLFIAIVIASAIRPIVIGLSHRGIPQVAAILSIYLVSLVVILALLSLAIPPLIRLTMDLFSDGLLVTQINSLLWRLAFLSQRQFQIRLPPFVMPPYLEVLVAEAAEDASDTARQQALPVAQGTLVLLGQIALVFVMGFYWLTSRQQIQRLLLRVVPYRRRADAELIWNDVEHTLGAYVRGQVILVVVIGLASLAGLLILRVPYPIALAVIAGITEAIPVVGPIIGAIPAVIVGFTVSPTTGLLVALWYLVIQQVEANVLVPKIMEENVGLNPLVVIVALAAGATLNGVVGAILAIPVAGAAQVLVSRLIVQPAIEKSRSEAAAEIEETTAPAGATGPVPDKDLDAPSGGETPPPAEGLSRT